MQKGSGFPEYTLVLLGIAIVVSIALAGLAGVYGEMAEWMKERFVTAMEEISNTVGDQDQYQGL